MPAENALELLDDAHSTIMRLAHGAERLAHANGDGTARQVADAYKRAASILLSELRPEVERLVRERDTAVAAVAGRTTPPTPAEAAAHKAAKGEWLLVMAPTLTTLPTQVVTDPPTRPVAYITLYVALDRLRRPCAWPVVAG